MVRHSLGRLALSVVVAFVIGAAEQASFAYARGPAEHAAARASKKRTFTLGDATLWVEEWGPRSHLTPETPTAEQVTDPAADVLRPYQGLVKPSFKGVAVQGFTLAQPNPTQPSVLVGSYIARAFVFGAPGDARRFRDADAKSVTDKRALVRIGTYHNGIVLADTQGHVNDMFVIGNVLVDLRIGVTENSKGAGVNDIKGLQDTFLTLANSKLGK
jgi:hypothetical protein